MAAVTSDQFLLSCINNSDLTKVDYAKVAAELGLLSAGAANNKRFSRWKPKVQAELAKGPDAAATGDGEDGSASPKKAKKTTTKKVAAAADGEEGTLKTPAKKRKLDEGADDNGEEKFKHEPKEGDEDDS